MDREVNLSEDTLLLCHAAGPGTCRVVFSLAPHGCKAQPRTALAKLAPTRTAAASEVALVAPGHVSGLASALQLVGVLETTCRRSSHSKATASKGWHWQLRPTRPSPQSGSQMRGWRWRPSDGMMPLTVGLTRIKANNFPAWSSTAHSRPRKGGIMNLPGRQLLLLTNSVADAANLSSGRFRLQWPCLDHANSCMHDQPPDQSCNYCNCKANQQRSVSSTCLQGTDLKAQSKAVDLQSLTRSEKTKRQLDHIRQLISGLMLSVVAAEGQEMLQMCRGHSLEDSSLPSAGS